MQETNANGTKDYAYDHRGNLLSVTSGEEVLRAYGFDAANQMNSCMGMTDGQIKKAVYQYNGLGHRMEQSIAAGDAAPEQTNGSGGFEWYVATVSRLSDRGK